MADQINTQEQPVAQDTVTPTAPVAPTTTKSAVSILDRMKANMAQQTKRKEDKPQEDIDVIITDVRPTQRVVTFNGKDIRVMQLITKDHGVYFPLENAFANTVVNYGEGVKAKITLQAVDFKSKAGDQVEGLNCTRVLLQIMDAQTEAAIGLLPKGTALFASM